MTKFFDSATIKFNGQTYTFPPSSGASRQVLVNTGSSALDWSRAETVVDQSTGISATATGTTNLYTVPAASTLIITRAVLTVVTSTTPTGTLKVGIGIAAGEDDIFSSTRLTGWDSVGHVYIFNTIGLTRTAPASSVIKLGIDTAMGGTVTFDVDLIGYFL